ncbi:TetR/AcrR family transcriptional regulator [Ornithinicoccus hortensis]|uniref:TetR family transcriptional regulator n=1 Tax=Ornithinicoccus hortensis TaxID=82346 RepID=A0A542YS88_9MICO|nr:TetR family transcriptional regulator [Ornithinicoccus hortensis]TQL50911.1 TetR family transcriptional regulator [Ornithinicoccus hortensis]
MSSASTTAVQGDLTARARIRDAAIRRFAEDGMGASLRSIATDAGVSAALILHHFGSRAGLRQACDDYVHSEVVRAKSSVLQQTGAGSALLVELAGVEGYAVLVGYVLRAVQAGDDFTAELVEGMVRDTLTYLEEGVRAGTVRASRFPEDRARMLVNWSLGSLLLRMPTPKGRLDLAALPATLRRYIEELMGPGLEIFTEPLLTDPSLLETYLTYHDSTPEETP